MVIAGLGIFTSVWNLPGVMVSVPWIHHVQAWADAVGDAAKLLSIGPKQSRKEGSRPQCVSTRPCGHAK